MGLTLIVYDLSVDQWQGGGGFHTESLHICLFNLTVHNSYSRKDRNSIILITLAYSLHSNVKYELARLLSHCVSLSQ